MFLLFTYGKMAVTIIKIRSYFMSENPEGTPNPLNPNTADPAEPAPAEPAENPADPAPAPEGAVEEKPAETNLDTMSSEPKGSIVEPANKKSKKGLIACLVILLLALIGGGVAAAIIFLGGGSGGEPEGDAVSKAVTKLFKGEIKDTTFSGTLDITASNSILPFSKVSASFDGGYAFSTNENYANATLTIGFSGGSSIKAGLSEVFDKDKNLFIKLTGDSNSSAKTETTNCAHDTTGMTNCGNDDDDDLMVVDCDSEDGDECYDYDDDDYDVVMPVDYSQVFDSIIAMIGNKWIRISASDIKSYLGGSGYPAGYEPTGLTQCLSSAFSNSKSASIDLAGLYEKNNFITSSTNDTKISKKNNKLFKLGIDTEKLANFVNSVSEKVDTSVLKKCGFKVNEATADDFTKIIQYLPTTYVEINGNYEITRLYLDFKLSGTEIGATTDVDLKYDGTVTINTPTEYTDFSDLTKAFMHQVD